MQYAAMGVKKSHISPNRMIVLSFSGIILAGSLLLALPVSARHEALPWIDAFFMAVSAACVTGLSVISLSELTLFGQIVILILIQLGGLGIMTFSILFVYLMGKKTSMRSREIVGTTLSLSFARNIRTLVRRMMLLVAGFELTGTLLLTACFFSEKSFFTALYHGFYHSVSAFCNAGFSLNPCGFESYSTHLPLQLILMSLIIAGGLGFVVLIDVIHVLSRSPRRHRLSFHSKMVLMFTGWLIAAGALLLWAAEWRAAGSLSCSHGLAALFQAVSARTAGFNTVPMDHFSNGSVLILMLLMFIGAAPGSCGGGIKVTTFGVLMLMLISILKGRRGDPRIFHRSISPDVIAKVTVIFLISIVLIIAGFAGLLVSEQQIELPAHGHGVFEQLLFETVSAFGTVGLSMGVTPQLSGWGKLIVALLMFLGRLGPLTVAVGLTRPGKGRFQYARGEMMVG